MKPFFTQSAKINVQQTLWSQALKLKTNTTLTLIETIVSNLICEKFPRAKCYLHGSRLYGVATKESDLNIYVDFGESPLKVKRKIH